MTNRATHPFVKLGAVASWVLVAWLGAESPAFAHDVTVPVAVHHPDAVWPGAADTHDVVVPVVIVVGEDGAVAQVEVEASVSHDLDHAAVDAASSFRYTPATRDGKPVSAKVREVVRFRGVAVAAGPAAVPATPEVAPHVHDVSAPPHTHAPPEPPKVEAVRVEGRAGARSASEIVRGRDVLGAAPHRTASDLLNVVPGVFVTQHSGEGKAHQIFMRGFDAVHGQDVELWVGGIPVNEVSNVHGQGYADLHFAPPEVVKEVVAQGGTYDPRQGDFGVAGTIRMKLGYAEPGIHTKGTIGSFGTRRLFLAYRPKDVSDETFASFEEYTTDGFGPNRSARRGSLMAQATHDFDNGLSARLLFSTYSGRFDTAGVVPQRDVEAGRLDRYATLDPKQGGRSSRTQLLLELHRDTTEGSFHVAPFVVVRGFSLRQNFTGFLGDSLRGGKDTLDSDNTEQQQSSLMFGGTASYKRPLKIASDRDTIEVGVYARHDRIEQSQVRLRSVDDRISETLVDADVHATDVAAYIDDELHLHPRLVLRGGVRVDTLAYAVNDRATNPGPSRSSQSANIGKKITADATIMRGLHVLASYGDGFRSPQARSLANGQISPFTKVQSFELGSRFTFGRALAGSAAVYTTSLSDDLVFDPVTARNEAVPGTRRVGGTLEMTARAGELLILSSSVTYTRAAFTGSNADYAEGDLLPYVPQLIVRSDAKIEHKLARLFSRDLVGRVGVGLDGVIRRPLPYGELGQNVVLTDATMGIRLKEVEISLDATNLLDQPYYDGQFVFASNFSRSASPSRIPVRHVTAGPPRAFYASLTLHL